MKTAGKTKRPVEPAFLRNDGLSLLLFGGKGGVGKTTCAAAAAITLALRHPQKQFLLVSTDPAHSLLDCFDGSTPPANLTLREIDPIDSLKRFKEDVKEVEKGLECGILIDGFKDYAAGDIVEAITKEEKITRISNV